MRLRIPRRKRLVILIAMIILAVPCLLICILPPVFALIVTYPDDTNPGDPPEGFTTISMTTPDDVKLAAWYAPPTNGAVIILIHGSGSGRQSMRGYAEMLHNNGFGVLAMNTRGFGDSDGQINRLGWKGTLDVGAALAYLENQPDVKAIGGLGLSMGGNILLGAASEYPQLGAIVADGASSRAVEEYKVHPAHRKIWRYLSIQVIDWSVQLLTDDEPPTPPLLDAMVEAESTYFLFIAAEGSQEEIDFNEEFVAAVGERASLWIVEDVGHTGGFINHPADYEARVVAFFEENLVGSENQR